MENWQKIYQERLMTADEAVNHIHSGDRVINSHLAGAPLPIVEAMCRNYEEIGRAHV